MHSVLSLGGTCEGLCNAGASILVRCNECVNALAACTTATVSSCTVGSITFGTAHALPHLAGTGLASLQVESAILGNLATAGGSAMGTHWAWVQVAGNWIQYRVHVLPSGIHVGTYFPVAGPLLNK